MTKKNFKWNRIAAILLALTLVFEQSPILYAQTMDAMDFGTTSDLDGEETPPEIIYTIDEDMVMSIPNQMYTGFQIKPEPVVAYAGHILTKDVDYTLSYGNNINVGKNAGTVTVKGIGSYKTKPSIVKSFTIVKCNVQTSPAVEITGVEDMSYTGGPVTPVHVYLTNGEDKIEITNTQARVTYSKNSNNKVGTCKVTIKGIGSNLCGKVTKSFKITQRNLNDSCIIAESVPDQEYEGIFIKPDVVLRNALAENAALVNNVDYTVTYKNNLLPTEAEAPAKAIIKGIGSYTGTREIPFTILGMDVSGLAVSTIPNQIYTGSEIEPELTVSNGKKILRKSIDYVVKFENNVNVGRAKVIISGRTGTIYEKSSVSTSFAIEAADLGTATVVNFGDVAFTSTKSYKQNEKIMKVRMPKNLNGSNDTGFYELDPKEYSVEYSDNYVTGETSKTATMTIVPAPGNDNYYGKIIKTFRVIRNKKLLNDYTSNHITVEGFYSSRKYPYDTHDKREKADHSISPAISVYYDGEPLRKGVDYTVSYKNNNAIGTATAVITAVSTSEYYGTREENYYIIGRPIFALNESDNPFKSNKPGDQAYTGQPIRPKLDLRERIIKRDGEKVYSRLTEGVDYKAEYKDNVDIGEAKGIVYGIGMYSGDEDNTAEIRFNIVPRQMTDVTLPTIEDQEYTGEPICPNTYLLNTGNYMIEGKDYRVEYGENTDVGIGTIRVIALESNPNYEGEATINFKIVPRNINSKSTVIEGLGTYRYAGKPVVPDLKLIIDGKEISEDEYAVTYTNNNTIGTAKVLIKARTGSSNYKGSIKTSFTIIGADMGVDNTVPVASYSYSGKTIKPNIETLVNGNGETMTYGVDYKMKVNKYSQVGIWPVEIIGLKNYAKSTCTVYYEIKVCEVTDDILAIKPMKTMALKSKYEVRPPVSIKVKGKGLTKGKDYLVSYHDNTSPGTGTCEIRFIGNYSGKASKTFTILP